VRANETPVSGRGSALRFLVVGASNNAAMYGLFIVLSLVGVGAIPAATVTYLLGMGVSFFFHRRWTFRHSGHPASAAARFLAANAAGYAVNVALLWYFVHQLDLPQIPVQFGAIAVVAVLLFVLMRSWVFRAVAADHEPEEQLGGFPDPRHPE
jgi:putative flippase GtrA